MHERISFDLRNWMFGNYLLIWQNIPANLVDKLPQNKYIAYQSNGIGISAQNIAKKGQAIKNLSNLHIVRIGFWVVTLNEIFGRKGYLRKNTEVRNCCEQIDRNEF
jgi:hypothetical protein